MKFHCSLQWWTGGRLSEGLEVASGPEKLGFGSMLAPSLSLPIARNEQFESFAASIRRQRRNANSARPWTLEIWRKTSGDSVRAAGLEPAQLFRAEGFSYQLRLSPPRLRACAHRLVCGLDYTFTVARSRFRCRPSSLYTFAPVDRPERLARDCQVKGFPEFGQFCIPGFPGSTQVASSPLRLPVPPRPH